ncbi:MAG: glutamine synthetase III, partial [Treponema sp.]|nr:glutamine synthetase III [Treponema sp.]
TFEARGYTAWDVTSPAFLKSDPTGTTLCIPTAFISYYGHALDQKVPLLKSVEALSRQALRLLRAMGDQTSRRVVPSLGTEQEYFLIDKEFYDARPDIMLTGRTVFGALPAKGQEMEDHYYGAIKERVAAFMRELNAELWKVGIPAKTQHNEVAPNQFEIVPVYSSCAEAADENQFIMEAIHSVARRYGMEGLLHEKPFAGVNGSGKHCNWSLETDAGSKIFDPGADPGADLRFLLFTAAVVEAIDRYALLLRSSAACAGNEHRLGANEAPPAIISICFGAQLTEIFESIASGKGSGKKSAKERIKIGVCSLPAFSKDVSDRNRTSPFAFTGNKFEFRMLGASESVAPSTTYLNVAVAQVLKEFAEKLESSGGAVLDEAVRAIIRESYLKHGRVVFNGNGYTEEWLREAERRGLPHAGSAVDALAVLARDDTVELFQSHGIFSREELESRHHIYLEKYSKQVNIEAGVTIEMARRQIFPEASAYAASLARDSLALADIGAHCAPQKERARKIAELCAGLYEENAKLEAILSETHDIEDVVEQARSYSDRALPAMRAVREKADALEKLVAKEAWPFPGYEELLFKL